jgi:hypothetical protein
MIILAVVQRSKRKHRIVVFWVVSPCNLTDRQQSFEITRLLHFQDKMSSQVLVFACKSKWCHNPEDHNLKYYENLTTYTPNLL